MLRHNHLLLLTALLALSPHALRIADAVNPVPAVNQTECSSLAGLRRLAVANYGARLKTAAQVEQAVAGAYVYILSMPMAMVLFSSDFLFNASYTLGQWSSVEVVHQPATFAPNADILMARTFADLSAGPAILTVPASSVNHWQLLILDFYGGTVLSINSQDTPTQYLLVTPGYTGALPAGFNSSTTIQASTNLLFGVLQTIVLNGDVAQASAVQDSFSTDLVTPRHSHSAKWVALLQQASTLAANAQGNIANLNILLAANLLISKNATAGLHNTMIASWAANGFDLRKPISAATFWNKLPSVLLGARIGAECLNTVTQQDIATLPSMWDLGSWPADLAASLLATVIPLQSISYGSWPDTSQAQVFNTSSDYLGRPLEAPYNYTFEVDVPANVKFWSLTVYELNSTSGADPLNTTVVTSATPGLVSNPVTGTAFIALSMANPDNSTANWLQISNVFTLVLRLYGSDLTINSTTTNSTARRSLLAAPFAPNSVRSNDAVTAATFLGTGYNVFRGCPLALCPRDNYDAGMLRKAVLVMNDNQWTEADENKCSAVYDTATAYSSTDKATSSKTSLSVDASYGPFSFGSSSSFSKAAATSSQQKTMSLTAKSVCISKSALISQSLDAVILGDDFQTSATNNIINNVNLDGTVTDQFQQGVKTWANTYGTHYIQTARFGGAMALSVEMTSNDYSSLTSSGFSWQVSAGAAMGGATVGSTVGSSSDQSLNEKYGKAAQSSNYGVIPSTLPPPKAASGEVDFTAWANALSLMESRAPIDYTLAESAVLFQYPLLWKAEVRPKLLIAQKQLRTYLLRCGAGDVAAVCPPADVCISGSYLIPGANATLGDVTCASCSQPNVGPNCRWDRFSSCNQNTCFCNSNAAGSQCEQTWYGTCARSYSWGRCRDDRTDCNGNGGYGRMDGRYVNYEGCQCICCTGDGADCGCGTSGDGTWCK